jgi:hypothetical protein
MTDDSNMNQGSEDDTDTEDQGQDQDTQDQGSAAPAPAVPSAAPQPAPQSAVPAASSLESHFADLSGQSAGIAPSPTAQNLDAAFSQDTQAQAQAPAPSVPAAPVLGPDGKVSQDMADTPDVSTKSPGPGQLSPFDAKIADHLYSKGMSLPGIAAYLGMASVESAGEGGFKAMGGSAGAKLPH